MNRMVECWKCGKPTPSTQSHCAYCEVRIDDPDCRCETVVDEETSKLRADLAVALATAQQEREKREALENPPCPVCGNEERTNAGYLSCECPDPAVTRYLMERRRAEVAENLAAEREADTRRLELASDLLFELLTLATHKGILTRSHQARVETFFDAAMQESADADR